MGLFGSWPGRRRRNKRGLNCSAHYDIWALLPGSCRGLMSDGSEVWERGVYQGNADGTPK